MVMGDETVPEMGVEPVVFVLDAEARRDEALVLGGEMARVSDKNEKDGGAGLLDRGGYEFGSGLKLLFEAQNINCELNESNLNIGPQPVLSNNVAHASSKGIIPSNSDPTNLGLENQLLADPFFPSSSFVPPSQRVEDQPPSSSRGVVHRRGKAGGQRGRGVSGGRGASGRGALIPGGFSTSHRFMHLAKAIGRRPRPTLSMIVPPSNSNEIDLQVVLPNLSEPLVVGDGIIEVMADVVHGNSVGDLSESGGSGSQSGTSASRRLLSIGRRIGVTFRCREDTMIGKLVQLEERDKREKEARELRDNGYQ